MQPTCPIRVHRLGVSCEQIGMRVSHWSGPKGVVSTTRAVSTTVQEV